MEPPPPKLKMSNYMKVLTSQAVADPSKVEKEVRKQIVARQEAHIEHNERRKLSHEQKREKFRKKMERQAQKECRVALFRVPSLVNPRTRFKVDVNAQQLFLNGLLVMEDSESANDPKNSFNFVVVEGGAWAVKKYKKLLLRRIQWSKSGKRDNILPRKRGYGEREGSEEEEEEKGDDVGRDM